MGHHSIPDALRTLATKKKAAIYSYETPTRAHNLPERTTSPAITRGDTCLRAMSEGARETDCDFSRTRICNCITHRRSPDLACDPTKVRVKLQNQIAYSVCSFLDAMYAHASPFLAAEDLKHMRASWPKNSGNCGNYCPGPTKSGNYLGNYSPGPKNTPLSWCNYCPGNALAREIRPAPRASPAPADKRAAALAPAASQRKRMATMAERLALKDAAPWKN